MFYYIASLIFVNIVWLMYGCIFNDYEHFIRCNHEKHQESCKDENTNRQYVSFKLCAWYVISWLFIILCLYRYFYQYNFVTMSSNIFIITYVSFILLYSLILFLTTLEHYHKHKNNRILSLYIVSLIGSLVMMILLFKYSLA